jgi:hypothetical protein
VGEDGLDGPAMSRAAYRELEVTLCVTRLEVLGGIGHGDDGVGGRKRREVGVLI